MRHLPSGSPRTAPRSELPRRTFNVNHRVVCLFVIEIETAPSWQDLRHKTPFPAIGLPKDDNLVDVKS